MASKKQGEKSIEIKPITTTTIRVNIVGISSLIVNKYSGDEVRDGEAKAPKLHSEDDPEELYQRTLYKFDDSARTGFPAVGFKAGMVRAGKQLNLVMKDIQGRFHVLADENDLVEIKGIYRMRKDIVRIGMNIPVPRFRAEYLPGWTATLTITYVDGLISEEQLMNLIQYAGFTCGIGEWRPEKSKSGSYGMYAIKDK